MYIIVKLRLAQLDVVKLLSQDIPDECNMCVSMPRFCALYTIR